MLLLTNMGTSELVSGNQSMLQPSSFIIHMIKALNAVNSSKSNLQNSNRDTMILKNESKLGGMISRDQGYFFKFDVINPRKQKSLGKESDRQISKSDKEYLRNDQQDLIGPEEFSFYFNINVMSHLIESNFLLYFN